jgi:hypothetical protein
VTPPRSDEAQASRLCKGRWRRSVKTLSADVSRVSGFVWRINGLRRATAGIATTLIGRQAGLFLVAESGGLTAVLVYWPAPTGGTAAMLALGLSYAVTINSVSTQSGAVHSPQRPAIPPGRREPIAAKMESMRDLGVRADPILDLRRPDGLIAGGAQIVSTMTGRDFLRPVTRKQALDDLVQNAIGEPRAIVQ